MEIDIYIYIHRFDFHSPDHPHHYHTNYCTIFPPLPYHPTLLLLSLLLLLFQSPSPLPHNYCTIFPPLPKLYTTTLTLHPSQSSTPLPSPSTLTEAGADVPLPFRVKAPSPTAPRPVGLFRQWHGNFEYRRASPSRASTPWTLNPKP